MPTTRSRSSSATSRRSTRSSVSAPRRQRSPSTPLKRLKMPAPDPSPPAADPVAAEHRGVPTENLKAYIVKQLENAKGDRAKEGGTLLGKRVREQQDSQQEHNETIKRLKTSVNAIAQEYICPITTELPLDPVTAEDGRVYDRAAIEEYILTQGDKVRSPTTNETMGKKLTPAFNVRNTIQHLVESTGVDSDLIKRWREEMKEKKMIAETKKKAYEGDVEAMQKMALWCRDGKMGFPMSEKQSFLWYEKLANKRDVRGMASAGRRLVNGRGTTTNRSQGLIFISLAAELGSDLACYLLGKWYHEGMHDLPKDRDQAAYWLNRVFDGSCTTKHIHADDRKRAQVLLNDSGH